MHATDEPARDPIPLLGSGAGTGAGPIAGAGGAYVETRGIGKRYGGVAALSDVSVTVRRGEIHGICGENG